jgi:hypothetical protein
LLGLGIFMNLDYIEISKSISKDKINFAYLDKNASFQGAERYYFDRCKRLEVWYYEITQQIRIKGSLPYWLNGHNYYSSLEDWKEGIDYMGGCLGINLYTGLIEAFEYGTIQEIPFNESAFLKNHVAIKGMQAKEYYKGKVLTGKEFHSPSLKVKLYDINRNIKNKLEKPIQDEISRLWGWNRASHYIKLENHYKKPEALLGGYISLHELISSGFQYGLKEELIKTYQSIMKTGKAIIPEKKADINAGTIPLLVLKELEEIHLFKTEELIRQKLKEIPEDILSPADRKARLRMLRENMKKISIRGESEYDISKLLKAKLSQGQQPSENSSPFIWDKKGEEILSIN